MAETGKKENHLCQYDETDRMVEGNEQSFTELTYDALGVLPISK